MNFTRRVLSLTALACAALAATGAALAQFPDKPMRIVVGAPAGGTADIVARTLSEGLAQQLGQPVMVDNKPGGAGLIGLQEVLKAPRDGHTVLVSVNGIISEIPHAMKLPVDPMKELRPVAEIARTGLLFVGGPNVPASNVKEVVAYIKANPGKVNYASYSPGTLSHTLGLEFNKLAGTDMVHVGYKGSPPALTDLIGGQVNYCFETMTSATPFVKSGKVVAMAQTRLKRAKSYPNVPTMAESGFPGFEATVWYGLMGPGKMPPAMAQRMNEDVNKVLAMPDVQEKMEQYGAEDGGGSIEKFASYIKDEQQKWAQVAKAANVKVDA